MSKGGINDDSRQRLSYLLSVLFLVQMAAGESSQVRVCRAAVVHYVTEAVDLPPEAAVATAVEAVIVVVPHATQSVEVAAAQVVNTVDAIAD